MIPGWLLEQKPSANELLVYATFARYGTFNTATGVYEECRPALSTVVEDCGLTLSPVKRAISDLIARGAMERTQRWAEDGKTQLPSVYRVVFGTLAGPGESAHGRGGGPLTDPGGSPLTAQNPEPLHQEPHTKKKTTPSATPRGTRVPEDFTPDAEMIEWARQNAPGIGWTEHEKFMDYWRAKPGKDGVKLDWVATWRNWMRRAAEGAGRRPVSGPPAARHGKPLHQKRAERSEALRMADALLEARGVDTESEQGAKLVFRLADEILAHPESVTSMNDLDIRMVQPYIEAEVISPLPAIGGAAQ